MNVQCVQTAQEITNNVKGKKSQKGDEFSQILEQTMGKGTNCKKDEKDQSIEQITYPSIYGINFAPVLGNTSAAIYDMDKMDNLVSETVVGAEAILYPSSEIADPLDREMGSPKAIEHSTQVENTSAIEEKIVENVKWFPKSNDTARFDGILKGDEVSNSKGETLPEEIKSEIVDMEIGLKEELANTKKTVLWEKKSETKVSNKGLSNEQYGLNEVPAEKGMDTKEAMKVPNNSLKDINFESINDTIIKLLETTTEGKSTVMKVRLYPEELGAVDILLKMEEGKLTARLTVENDQVKQLFISKASELNDNLLKQNIPIDKVEIDLNFNASSNFSGGFNGDDHFTGGQKSFHPNKFIEVEKVIEKEENIVGKDSISILA